MLQKLPVPPRKVPLRADAGALLAHDALAAPEPVFFQLEIHRAIVLTGLAAPDAVRLVSLQRRERQLRQKSEYGPHGAQELTEEPLFQRHSRNDRCQQDPADHISVQRKVQGCEEGEDRPGIPVILIKP